MRPWEAVEVLPWEENNDGRVALRSGVTGACVAAVGAVAACRMRWMVLPLVGCGVVVVVVVVVVAVVGGPEVLPQ